jgi:hypothetical protein
VSARCGESAAPRTGCVCCSVQLCCVAVAPRQAAAAARRKRAWGCRGAWMTGAAGSQPAATWGRRRSRPRQPHRARRPAAGRAPVHGCAQLGCGAFWNSAPRRTPWQRPWPSGGCCRFWRPAGCTLARCTAQREAGGRCTVGGEGSGEERMRSQRWARARGHEQGADILWDRQLARASGICCCALGWTGRFGTGQMLACFLAFSLGSACMRAVAVAC